MLVVRLNDRRFGTALAAHEDGTPRQAASLQLSVLLEAAGLVDASGNPIVGDAEAIDRLPPSGVPAGSCELSLWRQLAPLAPTASLPVPAPGQELFLDLRRQRRAPRCKARQDVEGATLADCERCCALAPMHPLTSRWQQQRSARLLRQRTTLPPLVVLVKSWSSSNSRRAALPTMSFLFDEESGTTSCDASCVLVQYALRMEALRLFSRCAICRAARACSSHPVCSVALEHVPVGVPRDTCRLQLWDGLTRVDMTAPLACLAKERAPRPLILTVRENSSATRCSWPDFCDRCARIADGHPEVRILRRRRHFWSQKRPAFLIRCFEAHPASPLATFLRHKCTDEVFRMVVAFI